MCGDLWSRSIAILLMYCSPPSMLEWWDSGTWNSAEKWKSFALRNEEKSHVHCIEVFHHGGKYFDMDDDYVDDNDVNQDDGRAVCRPISILCLRNLTEPSWLGYSRVVCSVPGEWRGIVRILNWELEKPWQWLGWHTCSHHHHADGE